MFFLIFLLTTPIFAAPMLIPSASNSSNSQESCVCEEESDGIYNEGELIELLQDVFDGDDTPREEIEAMIKYFRKEDLMLMPKEEFKTVCNYQLERVANKGDEYEIKTYLKETVRTKLIHRFKHEKGFEFKINVTKEPVISNIYFFKIKLGLVLSGKEIFQETNINNIESIASDLLNQHKIKSHIKNFIPPNQKDIDEFEKAQKVIWD